jgi:hypothetical protein
MIVLLTYRTEKATADAATIDAPAVVCIGTGGLRAMDNSA